MRTILVLLALGELLALCPSAQAQLLRRRRGSFSENYYYHRNSPVGAACRAAPSSSPARQAGPTEAPDEPREPASDVGATLSRTDEPGAGGLPTGVIRDQLHPGEERYEINGKPVPKTEALEKIAEPAPVAAEGVPDDSKLVRLTAIGAPDLTQPVVDDLDKHPRLAGLKDHYVLQVYDPGVDKTAWAVKRAGFDVAGKPSIYLEKPDGQVLAHLDHYPGAEVLAGALVAAVRKTDPNYDPKKDPDPTKPLAGVPLPVWLGGAGLALLLLLPKKT